MVQDRPAVVGVVLAAGSGTRYGMPKALVDDGTGASWAARTAAVLAAGGCEDVLVVVGAKADAVRRTLPAWVQVIECAGWAEGMGASLRAGLAAAAAMPGAGFAVVALVDTPGLTSAAVQRVIQVGAPVGLARAVYDGEPGHPVLIGAQHFASIMAEVHGDSGANRYLRGHGVLAVECGDLADGRDVDVPG